MGRCSEKCGTEGAPPPHPKSQVWTVSTPLKEGKLLFVRQRERFFVLSKEGTKWQTEEGREGRHKRERAPRRTAGIWMKVHGGGENTAF